MLTRIEYHPEAEEEFDASVQWYLQRGRVTAEGFRRSVEKAIEQAMRFPASGNLYLFGTRRIVLAKHPFILVYRVREQALQIIAVAHTSRRPGYWRDRLD